ncbi:unnamed protein product, partial [Pylaiella littoralis]
CWRGGDSGTTGSEPTRNIRVCKSSVLREETKRGTPLLALGAVDCECR